MIELKRKVLAAPRKPRGVGLRDATPEEIDNIKAWLTELNIPYVHRRNMRNGKLLPYSGVLYLNLPQKGRKL